MVDPHSHKLTMINVDIFTAVENSNLYLAKFLLKKGANPNQKNKSDLSLLQLAVTRTNDAVGVDMIQLLAKHGAHLSYKEPSEGKRAIDMAKGAKLYALSHMMSRHHWSKIRACMKFLSLHSRAVVTANHPSRMDFNIEKLEIFDQLRADLRKARSSDIMDMLEDIIEESGEDLPSYGEILETIGYHLETDF